MRKLTLREALEDLIREVGPTLTPEERNRLKQLPRDDKRGLLRDDRIEEYLIRYGGGRYEIRKGETSVIIHEKDEL